MCNISTYHQGLVPTATNLEMGDDIPKKAGAYCKGVWLQFIGTETPKPKKFQHPTITKLLEGFKGLFQEPIKLPLARSFDHKI